MWTPKRIVLLLVGFVLFLTAFALYSCYLGAIDGLPMLPPGYGLDADTTPLPPPPQPPPNELDEHLQMAFGSECPEMGSPIKFQVKPKGMVMAAGEFHIETDGRVRLAPLSVAIFKPATDGKFPDINTIRCHVAFLTFDQPITNPADLNKHRIVAAELVGAVTVCNNRRTPQIDDDLTVFTHGPMFYSDEDRRISTNAPIKLCDKQTKPSPTEITGVGLDLFLIAEDPDAKQNPQARKDSASSDGLPKQPAVTGVDKIILRQDVQMDLYTDSGMLGPDRDKKEPETPAGKPTDTPPKEKEKSHVVIKTQGPFRYDAVHYRAEFNVSDRPGPFPNRVEVIRSQDDGQIDELDCEKLDLQFRPREEESAVAPINKTKDDKAHDLEIETAHATGKYVTLKSDAQGLDAYGNDFLYNDKTRTTNFKGDPEMWAVKEGNELHCRELILVNPKDPKDKNNQQATAIGPGHINLLDKETGTRPRHAQWQDKLVFQKDGTLDLLVLTRDAVFQDDDHDQHLKADTIKVWMEGDASAKDKEAKKEKPAEEPGSLETSGRKPQKLEAAGHVQARAPQLRVPDSDRLVIWFKDVAPDDPLLPKADPHAPNPLAPQATSKDPPPAPAAPRPAAVAAPAAPDAPAALPDKLPPVAAETPQPAREPKKPATATAPAAEAAPSPAAAGPDAAPKPARPLELTARSIEVHVLRAGQRNELHRLFTEGGVHVKQEPETPEDRGIDILGETLQMTRKPEGNLLVVTDEKQLAQLRMNKVYIVGPVVHIDQADNKAWVNGDGLMEMESNVNFQGGKLDKSVPMRVFWKKTMYFDGQFAEFHGGVQAEQNQAVLLCQSMQVFLDKPVSLKDGDKVQSDKTQGGQPAKVRKLSCDQSVQIEDKTYENGRLVKYQRLTCPEVSMDNEEGQVLAPGPGVVRIMQPGSSQPEVAPGGQTARPTPPVVRVSHQPNAPDPKSHKDDDMKLTKINYTGRMYANNKNHTATFTDNVEVVNVFSEDPNFDPNIDKLPEGGFYLRSDRLEVYSREAEGRSSNELLAKGHITFKAQDCYGLADKVTYHEAKDQVILEGSPARVYRLKQLGGTQEELRAEKIIYLRKTGEFHIIGGNTLIGH